MNKSGSERVILLPLIVLSIAQLIGWGAVSFPAVVSRDMAADLRIDISTVFVGTTVFYVTMGACAPFLSRLFTSIGARPVMIAGTIMSAFGLTLVSLSHSPISYFLGWLVLGAAGSASLTTPAHILLNEIAGRKAARAIGGAGIGFGPVRHGILASDVLPVAGHRLARHVPSLCGGHDRGLPAALRLRPAAQEQGRGGDHGGDISAFGKSP
ncbi:MFS transporter [Rhizobium sp. ZK1]|uniref:MFS transporter n=1 Tax=Rhizobium sp. ZK1 TaxID=3389872 RepID=UPI0039F6F374